MADTSGYLDAYVLQQGMRVRFPKLIFTFLDVVEKVKPKAFVMENIKALCSLEKWKPIRKKIS